MSHAPPLFAFAGSASDQSVPASDPDGSVRYGGSPQTDDAPASVPESVATAAVPLSVRRGGAS